MIDYNPFLEYCTTAGFGGFIKTFPAKIADLFEKQSNSDLKSWLKTITDLPDLQASVLNLNVDTIQIGQQKDCSGEQRDKLRTLLMLLHPWRKGPYNLFDIFIDTEWRSDWKWQRLADYIEPLNDRLVLDIGCGNGYHLWRMAGAGAKLAMGIDPFLKNVIQFHAIQKYINRTNVTVLPLGIDDLPEDSAQFDTVFSMGILYHRRSPVDHLYKLRSLLRSRGELVLETLVIEGKLNEVLVPEGRYAKMRNIWFIPTVLTLERWLTRCGYKNIRLINITKTTINEQRSTEWMRFESLPDFLDPKNDDLTIEGLPAPRRAIFLAEV